MAPTTKKKPALVAAIVIGGAAALAIVLIVFFIGQGDNSVVHLQNDTILRFSEAKNYDQAIPVEDLALTLANVQYTQNYIRKMYPDFDFGAMGYTTDDYQNRLFVDDFNKNPLYMCIYLNGYDDDAGISAVYGVLGPDDSGKLWGYYYLRDQEFSDKSGLQYQSTYFFTEFDSPEDTELHSIQMAKFLYSDVDEWYWEILWDDDSDVSDGARRDALEGFCRKLRDSRVYFQLDQEFLLNIYTGIEHGEQIRHLVDWGQVDIGVPSPTPHTSFEIPSDNYNYNNMSATLKGTG